MNGDTLGFSTYLHHETGERRWGCRGDGPRYVAFYAWFNQQYAAGKITTQSDDWPWHYWGFNDPELDQYMRDKYAADIFTDL